MKAPLLKFTFEVPFRNFMGHNKEINQRRYQYKATDRISGTTKPSYDDEVDLISYENVYFNIKECKNCSIYCYRILKLNYIKT